MRLILQYSSDVTARGAEDKTPAELAEAMAIEFPMAAADFEQTILMLKDAEGECTKTFIRIEVTY